MKLIQSLLTNRLLLSLVALVVALLAPDVGWAAIGMGAVFVPGMILDAQNLYSDAQALTVTAVSTNIIDHGQDRNIGIGTGLALLVTVDVAAAGGGTLSVGLQTDDNAAFSSQYTVAGTAALAAAVLTAGAKIVLPVPADLLIERFTRVNYVMTTMTGITVTAALLPRDFIQNEAYYADAITIG